MSSHKQTEDLVGLEALVAEARNLDNLFRLYAETFHKRTGMFLTGFGAPIEYTITGMSQYIAYLKNGIETIKDIIQYIDGKKEVKKG